MTSLKDKIENLVSKSTPDNVIFSVQEVKNAIFSLKNGKKRGVRARYGPFH